MNFRMVSYADNYEDVLLQRAFEGQPRGFYIDVGSYGPVDHSVTKHFYDKGWHGINIEPNPAPFAEIQADRTRDINLNLGLSDEAGELTILAAPGACWSVDRNMLTGFFQASESDIVPHQIPVRTLAEICDEHVPPGTPIDFLKVDVEGHEGAVFRGGDWTRHRPRVVVAEAMGFEEWESILLTAGYHFTLFEGVNRFYVRDEDAHLISRINYPANVADSFLIYGYLKRINELQTGVDASAQTIAHQAGEIDRLTAEVNRLVEHRGGLEPFLHRVDNGVHQATRGYHAAKSLARRVAQRLGGRRG